MFSIISLFGSLAWAGPAMVTNTTGEVLVVTEGKRAAVPPAPFLLREGMELQLKSGAVAVVLYQGAAERITGPATTTIAVLSGGKAERGAGAAGSVIDELLSVRHDQGTAGAHRGAVQLQRPLPGGELLALKDIRWSCASCGPQTVEVIDFLEDTVVWTSQGTGSVHYDGPTLTGSSYQISLGGERFTVYLAQGDRKKKVEQATELLAAPMGALVSGGDPVGGASVLAGFYVQIGLGTEALYLLDSLIVEHPKSAAFVSERSRLEKRLIP